jgi:hypothetical protein
LGIGFPNCIKLWRESDKPQHDFPVVANFAIT